MVESANVSENVSQDKSRQLRAYKHLLAGGVAGVVSRTSTAPIDRLKVLLQVQVESPSRRGVFAGLSQIYHDGGVLSFFRGNGINILKVAPESAIKFYAYQLLKDYMIEVDTNGKMNKIGVGERLLAGGTAGAVAQAIIYPMDLVKTRLQTFACGAGKRPPPSTRLAHDILVREGPRAFYRGLWPSLLGMVPYAGIDLAAYETLKEFSCGFMGQKEKPGPLIQLGCGTVSGALGATCVYPLQLVRTRLQAQSPQSTKPLRYNGMLDTFQKTFQREGFKGFYKGLLPSLLKVVPAASITYVVYEQAKSALSLD